VHAATFADAGRLPFTPIQNLPNYSFKVTYIEVADDLVGSTHDVHAINSAGKSPVTTSPAPLSTLKRVKTINRLEGLAMLERRKAHLAQGEFTVALPMAGLVSQASTLKRVRTVNKLEGLGMLECRRARLDNGSLAAGGFQAQGSSLQRVRTINRLDGLAKLERRKATIAFPLTGPSHTSSSLKRVRTVIKSAGLAMLGRRSDAGSIVLAESDASTLRRVRTINKRTGQDILERRSHAFEKQPVRSYQGTVEETEASS
jgi:hypothetical protein